MKPQPAISGRVTSEKRAAASRANGAKSRGPVSAIGRANSSRNSRRHGLRSQTILFTDPTSLASLSVNLAAFERDLAPQSPIECNLVRMMAVADWRQSCLHRLETAMLDAEAARLKSLFPDAPPIELSSRAFRSLSDRTCFLEIASRLESRFERQYESAFTTLTGHRAWRAECAANPIRQKMNCNERTQQVIETTAPHFETIPATPLGTPQSEAAEDLNSKKVIISERTRQPDENTMPHSGLAAFSPGLTLKADS